MARYEDGRLNISLQTERPQKKSIEQSYIPAREDNQDRRARFLKDRYLEQLSKKNDQLRAQLRQISMLLSQKIQRKKVKKKKIHSYTSNENSVKDQHLRKELQNGYKQIDLLKKHLIKLKANEQGEVAHDKLVRLQNQIAYKQQVIKQNQKELRSIKNVKKQQQKQLNIIVNNTNLQKMITDYKEQKKMLKDKILQINKKQRKMQEEYKKQQAYQLQIQKKLRELNDQYHPDIKKYRDQTNTKNIITIQNGQNHFRHQGINQISEKQWDILKKENARLKAQHRQFYKKIDQLLGKNKKLQQQDKEFMINIKEKQREIEALKKKMGALKKLTKKYNRYMFGDGKESIIEQSDCEDQQEPTLGDLEHLKMNTPLIKRKDGDQSVTDSNKKQKSSNFQLLDQGNGKRVSKKWNAPQHKQDQKGKYLDNSKKFNDEMKNQNIRLKSLNIWTVAGSISVLQGVYQIQGTIKQSSKTAEPLKNSLQSLVQLQDDDYIKHIGGSFNQKGFISYLVITSKKGRVSRFGSMIPNQKQFNIDISDKQIPFNMYGASVQIQGIPRICILGFDITSDKQQQQPQQ